MKIILIGFMGSGKSAVAALLAESLQFSVFEMDDEIRRSFGMESISEVFRVHGEQEFRRVESETAAKAGALQNAVVSTGGGIVTRADNIWHLVKKGDVVVYLSTSFEQLSSRIATQSDAPDRPLFADPESAKELYAMREPLYRRYATLVVETDNKLPSAVAEEIIALLDDE